MTQEQIIFVLIVFVTLILFISERIRMDVAAMLTLLALAATGILTPKEALSGFASEPAIIVASVFVISAALTQTGITERIGAGIARAAGSREWRAILVVMPAVAMLAAFSHHLMITAMMLPIMMRLARVQNLSPSRLLMPMSLAASLGTTLTIFSAPAFLLMNHLLLTGEQETLGVFGITRTVRAPAGNKPSIRAVVTPAQIDASTCRLELKTGEISSSTAFACCGFTQSSKISLNSVTALLSVVTPVFS